MKYLTFIKANIKSQRGSFAGILVLMFFITVFLCAVLSIWQNTTAYETERLDRVGYGDLTWWTVRIPDEDSLIGQIEAVSDVESVQSQPFINFNEYYDEKSGKMDQAPGTLIALAMEDERYDYRFYNNELTGVVEEPEPLAEGEIYVSPAFSFLYDIQVDDTLVIEITGAEDAVHCRIKGYFEDPIGGSAMMGMKNILMNGGQLQKLTDRMDAAGEEAKGFAGSLIYVYQKPDSVLSTGELQGILNEQTKLTSVCAYSYSKTTILGFMLILQNIFTGFLLVFVLVLLMVAMIIIGHSIGSSIEQDYIDMGILKAIGFTQADLRIVQILQYLAAILCGMLPGIWVSMLLVKGINRLTVTATGLIIPADMPVGSSMLTLLVILVLLLLFIYLKTAKIGRITPIRAIRGGADDIYFKSRLAGPIHKKGLSFWMALRQLVSCKKQYVSVCLIAAVLVFFLSLTKRVDSWVGEDGKGLMAAFGSTRYDIGVMYENRALQAEVEDLIDTRAGILEVYEFKILRGYVNQIEYLMNVNASPEYFNIVEGRTCIYENEVVVTESVAKELNVRIGDTVRIGGLGEEQEFLISGFYQCANDMGANFGISRKGMERLSKEALTYYFYYILEEPSAVADLSRFLADKYQDKLRVDENTWSGLDSISTSMSALTVFMYGVTVIFILVAVVLTSGKILYQEQRDLGIYQSVGLRAGRLRFAFALRFGLVAAAGSVSGILLSTFLTDPMVGAMLQICGISQFTSRLDGLEMLHPALIVCGMFLGFAYAAAGKIRRVSIERLIVE